MVASADGKGMSSNPSFLHLGERGNLVVARSDVSNQLRPILWSQAALLAAICSALLSLSVALPPSFGQMASIGLFGLSFALALRLTTITVVDLLANRRKVRHREIATEQARIAEERLAIVRSFDPKSVEEMRVAIEEAFPMQKANGS